MDFRKIAIVMIAVMLLPLLAFAQHPSSMTVEAPAAGFQWNSGNKILQVTFTVTDDNAITDTVASLSYSTVQGAFTTSIIDDYNIVANTCATADFTSGSQCHYYWDARTANLANQTLYVDINAANLTDGYDINASTGEFSVNNRTFTGTTATIINLLPVILAALIVLAIVAIMLMAIAGQDISTAVVVTIATILAGVIAIIVLQFFIVL